MINGSMSIGIESHYMMRHYMDHMSSEEVEATLEEFSKSVSAIKQHQRDIQYIMNYEGTSMQERVFQCELVNREMRREYAILHEKGLDHSQISFLMNELG